MRQKGKKLKITKLYFNQICKFDFGWCEDGFLVSIESWSKWTSNPHRMLHQIELQLHLPIQNKTEKMNRVRNRKKMPTKPTANDKICVKFKCLRCWNNALNKTVVIVQWIVYFFLNKGKNKLKPEFQSARWYCNADNNMTLFVKR